MTMALRMLPGDVAIAVGILLLGVLIRAEIMILADKVIARACVGLAGRQNERADERENQDKAKFSHFYCPLVVEKRLGKSN